MSSKTSLQNDLRKRAALSGGQLQPVSADFVSASDVLDELHESLNKRVDAEVEALARGVASLVNLAEIGGKDAFRTGVEGFEIDSRVESLVRSTENLLSLSHALKLLFLLNDRGTETSTEQRTLQRDIIRNDSELAAREALQRVVQSMSGM